MTHTKQPSKLSQKGASGGEYGLIIGLVSVIAIGAVFGVGTQVKRVFDGSANALSTPTPAPVVLGVEDVPDVRLAQIKEDTSATIAQEDLLQENYIADGISILSLAATNGGVLTQQETSWIYTPPSNFTGTAQLMMVVQKETEQGSQTSSVRVFIPVTPVSDAPLLSASVEPGEPEPPFEEADFSQATQGARFDMTSKDWQSPVDGAANQSYNGFYEVTEAIASPHKDTFVFSNPSGTYTLSQTGKDDVIDLPNVSAEDVTIDGRNRVLQANGTTINYGNIETFKFARDVFTGAPHGIEFAYDLQNTLERSGVQMEEKPWLFEGNTGTFTLTPDSNPISQNDPDDPMGPDFRQYYVAFLDYSGTLTPQYSLDVSVASGYHKLPEYTEISNTNSNAFLAFASQNVKNMKYLIQRNGGEAWRIESVSNGTFSKHAAIDVQQEFGELIDNGVFYDIILEADDSVATMVAEKSDSSDGRVIRVSHDFGTSLNNSSDRIGVGAQQSHSKIIAKLSPTNWAPAAADVEKEIVRGDENVAIDNVLNLSTDHENDPLRIVSFDSITDKGGRVTMSEEGTFTYTPPKGFVGADSFGYTLADTFSDGAGTSSNLSQGTVRVRVTDSNAVQTTPGGDVALKISAQTSDESETLSLSLSGLPEGATLSDGTRTVVGEGADSEISLEGWDLDQLRITHALTQVGYSFKVNADSQDQDAPAVREQREITVSFS